MLRLNDRNSPNIVLAPSVNANRKGEIKLVCHPTTLRNMEDDVSRSKVGEYCGLVHGNLVEITGYGDKGNNTYGLLESVALFQGVKRPKFKCENDEEVHVYITNPLNTYSYRFKSIGPSILKKPDNAVFVTYVDTISSLSVYGIRKEDWGSDINGVVLYWEWVRSKDNKMPDFYDTRYTRAIWQKPCL